MEQFYYFAFSFSSFLVPFCFLLIFPHSGKAGTLPDNLGKLDTPDPTSRFGGHRIAFVFMNPFSSSV
jgi:hypothetical protein